VLFDLSVQDANDKRAKVNKANIFFIDELLVC